MVVAFNLGKYPVHLYLIGQQRAGHQMQAVANIKSVELVPMLNVSAGVTLQVLYWKPCNEKQIQMEKIPQQTPQIPKQ